MIDHLVGLRFAGQIIRFSYVHNQSTWWTIMT